MSDTHQTPTTRTSLAIAYLALTFAAGPLLVYWVDASTASGEAQRETPATKTEPDDPPAQPAEHLAEQLAETSRRVALLETALRQLEQAQTTALAPEPARQVEPATPGETPPDPTLEQELGALDVRRTADGLLISLSESDLHFQPGSASLPNASSAALARVSALLARHQDLQVVVRGHTDSQGSASTNMRLSERRALAVREMLVASGIAADRLQTEGLGETAPVADNQTAEGRARNRRVEVYLNGH